MAKGRRLEKVAALIKREVGQLLITGIRDDRIKQAMITITDIRLSGDLQHCKLFVSIYGEKNEIAETFEGLCAASTFLKGELGRRLQLRRAPEISFRLDKGIEKGTAVLDVLEKLALERKNKEDLSTKRSE